MSQQHDYTNTYLDTRGTVTQVPFCEAILEGIAPGGGLFVPEKIPHFTSKELLDLADLTYPQLAARIYCAFDVNLPEEQIKTLMARAYSTNFDDPTIAPLRTITPRTHVLELWHGPTAAFKDMALQCLPLFFSAAIEKQRQDGASKDYMILVATSGDTGKAALEGFADRRHTNIIVYYPDGGVSAIQHRQMVSQRGNNVGVFAMRGNFDDCQTTVKQVFGDSSFADTLAKDYNIKLSSANSINWGRLLPQIVYYLSAYLQLIRRGSIQTGEAIDVCVPTGNFGNILAAWYARSMGVPIERLLCASNDNRVLADFINTGTYDIRQREFILTPSPSMDILVSSNLERQLFELCDRDPKRICTWMSELRDEHCFRIDKETFSRLRACFVADWVSADESLATIREVFEQHGYLLDPHSAVGWKVAERLRGENHVVVAATAHWAKFDADVYRALQGIAARDPLPPEAALLQNSCLGLAEDIAAQHEQAGVLPRSLSALKDAPVRFTEVVEGNASAAMQAVLTWLA